MVFRLEPQQEPPARERLWEPAGWAVMDIVYWWITATVSVPDTHICPRSSAVSVSMFSKEMSLP